MYSSDAAVAEAFRPFAVDPDADNKQFVECSGRIAKRSAHYLPLMCDLLLDGQNLRIKSFKLS